MSHQAGRDVEIACDDEVIRGMDRESRGYYGSTIFGGGAEKAQRAGVFHLFFRQRKIRKGKSIIISRCSGMLVEMPSITVPPKTPILNERLL